MALMLPPDLQRTTVLHASDILVQIAKRLKRWQMES